MARDGCVKRSEGREVSPLNNLVRLKTVVLQWIRSTASTISHETVIKDITHEIDISGTYAFALILANLIALAGLITNSAPVVIGAMLISPFMGPILSFGFAFVTGEKTIWRKSVVKIVGSVLITIAVAALASAASPLKEVTTEIISRTRPNLYDLVIAFLAGLAGSAALCTKRNYLTIVPGVAIATAVIPPLSVAGFGAGTGNFAIFAGGFFLFFTNFVAIILASCIVFIVYGFHPSMVSEMDVAQLRKRFAFLAFVLIVISIPLVYTLHASLTEVKLRNDISLQLQRQFNREKQSHLTSFEYRKKDGEVQVNAVVNAVEYLHEADIATAEKDLSGSVGKRVRLNVEQVKVQPGGLRADTAKAPAPAIAPRRPSREILQASRENAVAVIRQSAEKAEKIMFPSSIADFVVGFHDKTFTVSILMKIRRDTPVSDEERLWLKRLLSAELNLPVELSVETTPFVPMLVFERGKTALSDEMRTLLGNIRGVYQNDPTLRCMIEAFPERGLSLRKRRALSVQRIEAVEKVLMTECSVPRENIDKKISSRSLGMPALKVTVMTHQGGGEQAPPR
jgi:uncharacterized hydrophobic protein (TIGR00271 family)